MPLISTTEILCIAFAVDDAGGGNFYAGRADPEAFITAASDPSWSDRSVIITDFECAIATRILTPRYGWPQFAIAQQRCSMTFALINALPGGLDKAAAALDLAIRRTLRAQADEEDVATAAQP